MLMDSSMGTDTLRCSQLAAHTVRKLEAQRWGRGAGERRARRHACWSRWAAAAAIEQQCCLAAAGGWPSHASPSQHSQHAASVRTLVVARPDGADALRASEEGAGQHKGAVAVGAPLLKPALAAGVG